MQGVFLRLCSTPIDSSVKKLFLHRLMAFKNYVTTLSVGFISDVTRIINKYKLNNFIENFISKSYFPPKTIWKHIVKPSLNYCDMMDNSHIYLYLCYLYILFMYYISYLFYPIFSIQVQKNEKSSIVTL